MMFQIFKFSLFLLPPYEIGPTTFLGHLVEGPGNMGESQHEHVTHSHQQCRLGITLCSCQNNIFPSWQKSCVAIECSKLVEYAACDSPTFC
jgi:hypothetical protein